MELVRDEGFNSFTEGLISVIVPVFNRSGSVGRLIEQILGQTYSNFELILIDDGSTDDSCDVCRKYQATDSRIRFYEMPHAGVASARNCGLEKAAGEFITFVDSDDQVEKDLLEKLHNVLARHGSMISLCDYAYNKKGVKTACHSLPYSKEVIPIKRLLSDFLYEKLDGGFCWGILWRREAVAYKFLPYIYAEDMMFLYTNLSAISGTAAIVDEPLYYYNKCEDSITASIEVEEMFDTLRIAKKIIRLSQEQTTKVKRAAYTLAVDFAFFAYLTEKAGNKRFSDKVDALSVLMIRKYRCKAIFDLHATRKTRYACFLSLFSMKFVKSVYSRIK